VVPTPEPFLGAASTMPVGQLRRGSQLSRARVVKQSMDREGWNAPSIGRAARDYMRNAQLREIETFAVVERRDEVADGVIQLLLRPAGGQSFPMWQPGAHIDVILDATTVRQYSLCGDRNPAAPWRVGILLEPNSRGGSLRIHRDVRDGDELLVRGPRNHFNLGSHNRYIFIGGGIGITPLMPMIAEVHAAGKPWVLHYGGKTRTSMAFVNELLQYDGDVRLYPQDEVGLVPLPEILAEPSSGTGVYCCGPEPMLQAIESFRSDWPHRSIHMERFAATPSVEGAKNRPLEVELAQSGFAVTVAADESILSAVRRLGVGVLSSCTEGTCGTCETPVLAGIPDHRDSVLDADERFENRSMMICVSRALSARLILDL
jgi:ferredoxin-NADP reductase